MSLFGRVLRWYPRPVRDRRTLHLLGVVVPGSGLVLLIILHRRLLSVFPDWNADAMTAAIGLLAVLVFARMIFRVIHEQDRSLANQHAALERRYLTELSLRAQMEAVHQAAMTVASARTPAHILQRLVDLACGLISARAGALLLVHYDDSTSLDTVYTFGLDKQWRVALDMQGSPLREHCVQTPLRIADVSAHDGWRACFPDRQPIHSLLGVPVAHGDRIVGTLYLFDRLDVPEMAFSIEDERLLTLLAGHAAIVIENARLAEQVRSLAIVTERERISKELHDGVIQSIYATTLELENAADDVREDPAAAHLRIGTAIERLDGVIRDLRGYILGLQPVGTVGQTLPQALAALLAEIRAHTLIETDLEVTGDEAHGLPSDVVLELVKIARESTTNSVRHAQASRIWVTLSVDNEMFRMHIGDNGVGFDSTSPPPAGHYGLHNLRERVDQLGGVLNITAAPGQGTIIAIELSLGRIREEQQYVGAHNSPHVGR